MATWAFGRRPVRRAGRRRSGPARALGDVDLDRQVLGAEQVGLDHVGDGEGIVHWGVVMPVDLRVEPAVERVQVGDHRARAAGLAQRLGALRR